MLGAGVYCSVQQRKAEAYKKGADGVVLKLLVRTGRVKKIDRQGHPLQKTWHENGYDSAWVPKGTLDMAPSGREENCVWDPRRIKILGRVVG